MKTKTQSQSKGKTALLRLRCTEGEKAKITKRAERAGKSLSEYAREAILTAEVISRRPISPHEAEAIRILQRVAQFFGNVSKLIKVKDPAWLTMTKNLALISRAQIILICIALRNSVLRIVGAVIGNDLGTSEVH